MKTIVAQTFRPVEIILVENNSTDDTWEVCRELEQRFPGVVRAARVEVHKWEYACSVAVNVGVRLAQYESIIRMDCDTTMSRTMIEEAILELRQPDTSAVAVNLRIANPTVSWVTRLQSIEYLLAMELERRFQLVLGSIICCSGGLSAYRRSTILEAGGFCSAPKWVSEDLDMTMKAHRLGHVRMAPKSIGYTSAPETLRALFRQRCRWGTTGIVAFYLHHRGIARRPYWYDGRVGFCGLPLLGVIKLRDTLGFTLLLVVPLAVLHGGWTWLAVFAVVRMLAMTAQLLVLTPALESRQGLQSIWLVPAFICMYGPFLLAARCVGAWRGIVDIRHLRKRIVTLEHAGLDPQLHLARGLDLTPAAPPRAPGLTDRRPVAPSHASQRPQLLNPTLAAGIALAFAVSASWSLRRR